MSNTPSTASEGPPSVNASAIVGASRKPCSRASRARRAPFRRASLRLDPRLPDDLAPAPYLGLDERAEFLRRAGDDVRPLLRKPCPDRRLARDGDDLARKVAAETGDARIRLGVEAVGGAATGRLAC